jgi:hypothetical protein
MRIIIPAALAMFLGQGALAQSCLTWVYVGSPFTTVSTTGTLNNLTVHSPIVGIMTFTTPLAPNLANAFVVPATWDYTLVDQNFTSTNGWFLWASNGAPIGFDFTTDAAGNIVSWNVSIGWDNGPGTQNQVQIEVNSSPAGDSEYVAANNVVLPGGPTSIAGSSALPGKWTCIQGYSTDYSAPPAAAPAQPASSLPAAGAPVHFRGIFEGRR